MQKLVLNTILLWGSTPKSEANAKKWVCMRLFGRVQCSHFTPVCDKEPAAVFVDAVLLELLPRC